MEPAIRTSTDLSTWMGTSTTVQGIVDYNEDWDALSVGEDDDDETSVAIPNQRQMYGAYLSRVVELAKHVATVVSVPMPSDPQGQWEADLDSLKECMSNLLKRAEEGHQRAAHPKATGISDGFHQHHNIRSGKRHKGAGDATWGGKRKHQ